MTGQLLSSKIFTITDDSGFIAIANPEYSNLFISPNWDFPQLKERLIAEMNKEALVIWVTGIEGTHQIQILDRASSKKSFREFMWSIKVTDMKLCLTNYEDLSMAAQFEDSRVPSTHNAHLCFTLPNGKYKAIVRQLFDHNYYKNESPRDVDFEIILQQFEDVGLENRIDKIFWS